MPNHHKSHHYSPQYKVGLGQTLARSRIIFLIIVIIFLATSSSALYAGFKDGSIQRNLITPTQSFFAGIGEAMKESTRSATPNNYGQTITIYNNSSTKVDIQTPTPTPQPTKKPTTTTTGKQPTQPAVANCIRKNIREGEFASNKCYSSQDYEDLNYYLNQYNSAVASVNFYQTKVNISCSNNDFFKTCEQDKKDQQANLDNIPKYRSIIQGIIARGK